jgi:ATP/ADP translocase
VWKRRLIKRGDKIMIILTIILTVLTVVGICMANSYNFDVLGAIIACFAGVFLLIEVIVWPLCYYSTKGEIQQYYSVKQTIEDARDRDIDSIERAALTQKIIEANNWLAGNQYWNTTIFDKAIPDEIETLKPLK